MAGSLNKVMLIGRLGKDPEIRYTQSGHSVGNFTLATNEYWTDNQGQKQERTEWHNIVVWDRLADQAQSFLRRGSLVYIEGRLQTRSWDDNQTGQKKFKTEIVANTVQFLEPKSAQNQASGANSGYYSQQMGNQSSYSGGQGAAPSYNSSPAGGQNTYSSQPSGSGSYFSATPPPPRSTDSNQGFVDDNQKAMVQSDSNKMESVPNKEAQPGGDFIDDDIPF